MENYKIRVNNKKESKEIQKLLLQLGCKWSNYGRQTIKDEHIKTLYIYNDSSITYDNNDNYFTNHPNKEVTIKDLKAMLEEKDVTERGGEVKINIEVKPKHPKVWAWDDDVTQAVETYLIAELTEMQDNCNYLVVTKREVERFEKKNFFGTAFYKNISHTNPTQNKEITDLIEKYGKEEILKYLN